MSLSFLRTQILGIRMNTHFYKFISHLELSLGKSLLVKISPIVLGNYSSLITWCRKGAGTSRTQGCIWGITKTFKESYM